MPTAPASGQNRSSENPRRQEIWRDAQEQRSAKSCPRFREVLSGVALQWQRFRGRHSGLAIPEPRIRAREFALAGPVECFGS